MEKSFWFLHIGVKILEIISMDFFFISINFGLLSYNKIVTTFARFGPANFVVKSKVCLIIFGPCVGLLTKRSAASRPLLIILCTSQTSARRFLTSRSCFVIKWSSHLQRAVSGRRLHKLVFKKRPQILRRENCETSRIFAS